MLVLILKTERTVQPVSEQHHQSQGERQTEEYYLMACTGNNRGGSSLTFRKGNVLLWIFQVILQETYNDGCMDRVTQASTSTVKGRILNTGGGGLRFTSNGRNVGIQ